MGQAEGSACPDCGRKRDAKLRCWKCFNRPCLECGVLTGGAFFPYCIAHQGVVPDESPAHGGSTGATGGDEVQAYVLPDGPHDPPSPPKQWVLVLEAESGPIPMAVRVRQVLKYALRRQGLHAAAMPMTVPDEADVNTVLEE